MSKRSLRLLNVDTRSTKQKIALFQPKDFNIKRCRALTSQATFPDVGRCVIYWMSRDQRMQDNHSLLYAQGIAKNFNVPLRIVFNLVPRFLQASLRQYGFMLKGLQEVEQQLRSHNIPFHLLFGDPTLNIPAFAISHSAYALVTDFSPLRTGLNWVTSVAESLDAAATTSNPQTIPMFQVDAHNIVPCWEASDKLEYAARTIRPKINSKIPEYLTEMERVTENPTGDWLSDVPAVDWHNALASLEIDRSVPEVHWLTPGPTAALSVLDTFLADRLAQFADKRNDPNRHVASNLSPYLHFGQISAQRVAFTVKCTRKLGGSNVDSFLEELVVRRELADNFCFYNPHYDSLQGCSSWARETLTTHSTDPRTPLYSLSQFEAATTHDDLWNAAQVQMMVEGKMHGFLRMYWAKKILEWSASPELALATAIQLNDKYELDGRDPNGFVGVMWAIGGVHDQGWAERAVFGKIRFMNYAGCVRKFDVKSFVKRYPTSLLLSSNGDSTAASIAAVNAAVDAAVDAADAAADDENENVVSKVKKNIKKNVKKNVKSKGTL